MSDIAISILNCDSNNIKLSAIQSDTLQIDKIIINSNDNIAIDDLFGDFILPEEFMTKASFGRYIEAEQLEMQQNLIDKGSYDRAP